MKNRIWAISVAPAAGIAKSKYGRDNCNNKEDNCPA